jgi:hypothetical protein
MLDRAGVPVRIAVGFVGSAGRALPGLHAWVEYRGSNGVWRWADASRGAGGAFVPDSATGRRPVAGGSGPIAAEDSDFVPAPTSTDGLRPAAGVVILTLLVVGVFTFRRKRLSVRDIRLADDANVAALLRGALARPESYREVPALFHRRVVPLIAGRSLSLESARSLAGRGRLAAGTASSTLARTASDRRRAVVDTSRPEGRAVAGVLGAVDLDRWERMIGRSETHPVLRRLEDEASAAGLSWTAGLTPDAGGAVRVLDGRVVGRKRGSAVVVADPASEVWRRVVKLVERAPATAVLLLADEVAGSMPEKTEETRRLLARLAAAAVFERAERLS